MSPWADGGTLDDVAAKKGKTSVATRIKESDAARGEIDRIEAVHRLEAAAKATRNPAIEIAARYLAGDRAPASSFTPNIIGFASHPLRTSASTPNLDVDTINLLIVATGRMFALGVRHDDALYVASARLLEALRHDVEATANPQKLATIRGVAVKWLSKVLRCEDDPTVDRQKLANDLAKAVSAIESESGRDGRVPPLRRHRPHVREHVLAHINLVMRLEAHEPHDVLAPRIALIASLNGAAFAIGLTGRGINLDEAASAVHTVLGDDDPTPQKVLEAIARAHGRLTAMKGDAKKKRQRAGRKKRDRTKRQIA